MNGQPLTLNFKYALMNYIVTDWLYYRWRIFAGLLLLPLFGIGAIILLFTRLKMRKSSFRFDSEKIEFLHAEKSQVLLKQIQEVRVLNYQIVRNVSIADLSIKISDDNVLIIPGLKGTQFIASAIETNIELVRNRIAKEQVSPITNEIRQPSRLEHMNDLVGLWQQGLISEEDYTSETKKFS
jgi:hypothetical protein